MDSIPQIKTLGSDQSFSDDDSDYSLQRAKKDKKKKEQLMAQRLRGRTAKTQRLRKDSDTNYGDIQVNNNADDDLNVDAFWNQIKDKNPQEVRNASVHLFSKNTGKGGRTRKVKRVKKRRTRKVRRIKKSRKTKRMRK
jgi:hypothetical protein